MSDEREGLRAREIRAHLLGDAEQFGARRDREPRDQYEAIGRNMLAAVDLIDALLREGGEPVAWLVDIEGDHPHATIDREDAERDAEHARGHTGKPVRVVPLYASPVARELRDNAVEGTVPIPVVMALCEQDSLILRPNVLYRFEPVDGCARCAEIMGTYAGHEWTTVGSTDPNP